MNFFMQTVKTRLKLLLEPAFICLLLVFPLALAAINMLWTEDASKIRVGIIYSEEHAEVAADFTKYMSDDAEVTVYTDEQTLADDVAKWKLECGYVLNADSSIARYVSPQSITADVADIMLVIALMRTNSGEYGYEIVSKLLPNIDKDEMIADITHRTEERLDSGERMEVEAHIKGADPAAPAPVQSRRAPLFGIAAVFAFLIGLLFAMSMADERKSGIYKALKASGANLQQYMLYNMASVFVAVLGFLLISLVVLGIGAWAADIALCICYALAVAALSSCAALLLPKLAFPALLSFSLISCMLFGGVAFDIGEIVAWISPIKYVFITSYFIEAINGALYSGIAALCGIAAAAVMISMACVRKASKRMG